MIAQALNTHKEQGPVLPVNPHLPSAEREEWETLESWWKPLSSIRRADSSPAGFQGIDSFSAELFFFPVVFHCFLGFFVRFVGLFCWVFKLHKLDQEGKEKKWGISHPSRSQHDITLRLQSQFTPRVSLGPFIFWLGLCRKSPLDAGSQQFHFFRCWS